MGVIGIQSVVSRRQQMPWHPTSLRHIDAQDVHEMLVSTKSVAWTSWIDGRDVGPILSGSARGLPSPLLTELIYISCQPFPSRLTGRLARRVSDPAKPIQHNATRSVE